MRVREVVATCVVRSGTRRYTKAKGIQPNDYVQYDDASVREPSATWVAQKRYSCK